MTMFCLVDPHMLCFSAKQLCNHRYTCIFVLAFQVSINFPLNSYLKQSQVEPVGIPTESSQGPPLQMFSSKRPPTCVTAYFSIFCDILQISMFLINKYGFQRCVGRSWNLGIRTCYYIVGRPWHLKFNDWLLVSCLFYLFTVAVGDSETFTM